jgi:hypothetical protein
MEIRYHIDQESGQPHIYQHDVSETEVQDILARPMEDRQGTEGSRVAVGHTRGGR